MFLLRSESDGFRKQLSLGVACLRQVDRLVADAASQAQKSSMCNSDATNQSEKGSVYGILEQGLWLARRLSMHGPFVVLYKAEVVALFRGLPVVCVLPFCLFLGDEACLDPAIVSLITKCCSARLWATRQSKRSGRPRKTQGSDTHTTRMWPRCGT